MAFLTLDRLGNVLLLSLPSIIISEFVSILGLAGCWSVFLSIWLAGSFIYLTTCAIRLSPKDKAVLVTGCDTGFGHATAYHLLDLGFTVFAGCLNSEGLGAETLRALKSDRLHVVQLNVTSEEETRKARKHIDKILAANALVFWGVINNAGLGTYGELEWVPVSTCKRVADVNVFGMINIIKVFLPLIRKSQGRILNVASMLGRMAPPMRSTYVLTKFAVGGLSDSLRKEMIPWGVNVIVVEPGNYIAGTSIYTADSIGKLGDEMWESMSEETRNDYGQQEFRNRVEIMKTYVTAGETDLTKVLQAFSDGLLQKYPQARYQPMDLYYKTRTFCAWHLPEWLYDLLYRGFLSR